MELGIEGVEDILLVDDNSGDIRLIEEAFEASPIDPTIHTARTREEALEILFQRGNYQAVPRPDLVLLDWNLANHTGEEVLQAVKSVDSDIPVVVMSGSKHGLERIESSTPAADEYIEKQVDPHQYIELLRSCCAEQ